MKFFLSKQLPAYVKTSEFLIFLGGFFNNLKLQNKFFIQTPQNYNFDDVVFFNDLYVNSLISGFKI